MDIAIGISGIILGAFFSWLFTHIYHSKSTKEANLIKGYFDKLPEVVRDIVRDDRIAHLSPKDLVLTMNRRLYNKENADKGDPLPYNFCPRCGSEQLARSSLEKNDDCYYIISCSNCQWQDWSQ
jgi:hypothetical protein